MTAAIVRLDDLDAPATCTITAALDHLAALHHLPAYVKAYPSPSGVHIAATRDTAPAWRAALGAPDFTREDHQHYTRFKTEVVWFGLAVRLSYCDY